MSDVGVGRDPTGAASGRAAQAVPAFSVPVERGAPSGPRSYRWLGGVALAASSLALLAVSTHPPRRAVSTGADTPAPAVERSQRVHGRILSQDGVALSNVAISITYPWSSARPERITTGGAGEFSFWPRAEQVRIAATHDLEGRVETDTLRIDTNDPAFDPLVLVLSRPPALSGRVLDEHGDPIAHAELRLEAQPLDEDGPRVLPSSISTDEAGAFSGEAPAAGAYLLTAWARGFAPRAIALGLHGDESSLRFSLKPYRSPRGVVRDDAGKLVDSAYVVACPGDDEIVLRSATNGTFEFGPDAVGCAATAYHEGFAHSRPVRLESPDWNELKLERGGTIEGIVTDQSGHAVTATRVEISSFSASPDEAALENVSIERTVPAARDFRIVGLTPGTYTLSASRDITTEDGDTRTIMAVSKPLEVTAASVLRGVHVVVAEE